VRSQNASTDLPHQGCLRRGSRRTTTWHFCFAVREGMALLTPYALGSREGGHPATPRSPSKPTARLAAQAGLSALLCGRCRKRRGPRQRTILRVALGINAAQPPAWSRRKKPYAWGHQAGRVSEDTIVRLRQPLISSNPAHSHSSSTQRGQLPPSACGGAQAPSPTRCRAARTRGRCRCPAALGNPRRIKRLS